MLSASETKQFDRDGYISPVSVLTLGDANTLRQKLEVIEAAQNGALYPAQRNKSFLLFCYGFYRF